MKITALYTTASDLSSVNAIPLYGPAPAAGFPAPGDDMVEQSLNVNDLLVRHPASTFFVRVEGDSMEGAGIYSGDILVIDRSVEARHDSIVVAVVGGGLVVKRLQKSTNGLMLVSENESYSPIILSESDDCFIWGVVTGSVRQF